jgi:hypothetical protein
MPWSVSAECKLSDQEKTPSEASKPPDQEQLAHTAAVEQTELLRREFVSADSTIFALHAELAALRAHTSELQASHHSSSHHSSSHHSSSHHSSSHHSSTLALQEPVKQLQQLLEQEQAAHTAALVKTESLRREFLSADTTISALGAQLSELQISHDSCTQALQERNCERKILESVLAESCDYFRHKEQAEAEMAPLRGHSPLVDAAISRFLLLSQLTSVLTSRLRACQQEMAQSLAASEEDRQRLLRKLDLVMDEYDRLRDVYAACTDAIQDRDRDTALAELQETATLSRTALQQALVDVHEGQCETKACAVKIINLENEAIELRAILAQVEQALGCPWPAFARRRLWQNSEASVVELPSDELTVPSIMNHLLAQTNAANLYRMSSPLRTPRPFAIANRSFNVPPPGFTLSENAERAAIA